jgi:hypothetical protein
MSFHHLVTSKDSIPNGTFEAWDSVTTYALHGWYGRTDNSDTAFSIMRTTDHFTGKYAALIRNKVTSTDTLIGMAATLPVNSDSFNIPSFKVSQRYTDFSFAYKYQPQNNDSMNVSVTLFKNHAQIGQTGFQSGATVNSWSQQTVSISYSDQSGMTIPDSATIFLSSFNGNRPKGNSQLFIDSLAFAVTTQVRWNAAAPVAAAGNDRFSVSLPALSRQLSVQFQLSASDHVNIMLTDIAGREIKELVNQTVPKGAYSVTCDLSHLSKGVYLVQKKTGSSLETKEVVVSR